MIYFAGQQPGYHVNHIVLDIIYLERVNQRFSDLKQPFLVNI